MRNSQLRYAIIYVIITALALCFLNIYAARTSRNLVFRANEPISWSVSLDCGQDASGKCIYFLYDDGVTSA